MHARRPWGTRETRSFSSPKKYADDLARWKLFGVARGLSARVVPCHDSTPALFTPMKPNKTKKNNSDVTTSKMCFTLALKVINREVDR